MPPVAARPVRVIGPDDGGPGRPTPAPLTAAPRLGNPALATAVDDRLWLRPTRIRAAAPTQMLPADTAGGRIRRAAVLQRNCEGGTPRKYTMEQDPDKTGKIDNNSRREAFVATEMMRAGTLTKAVRPNERGHGDFIENEGAGAHWDVKGYRSKAMSDPNKVVFDLERHVNQMATIIGNGYGIIIDAANLEPGDRAALQTEISSRGWTASVKWFG
jgi:hypothetical protein